MNEFNSCFANDLADMIEFKVSLGGSASTYLPRAIEFDTFCCRKYKNADHLGEAIAFDWLKESLPAGNNVANANAAFLRVFAFYLKSVGKEAYILPVNIPGFVGHRVRTS